MSNGDDVLDSWEEIDEVNLNRSLKNLKATSLSGTTQSTSTNTQSSAITKFDNMKLLQRPAANGSNFSKSGSEETTDSALDTMTDTLKPVLMMLHNPNDEYQSANYMAPIANQTVKILRRPSQLSDAKANNDMSRKKQPVKTLQQREQEYAEARLRILGAAKNPEDDEINNEKLKLEASATTSTSITTTTTNANVKSVKNMPDKQALPVPPINDDNNDYKNYNLPISKPKMQSNYFYPAAAGVGSGATTSNPPLYHTRHLGMIPTLPPQTLLHTPNYSPLSVMMHGNQAQIPMNPWLNNVPVQQTNHQHANHFYLQANDHKQQQQQQQQQQHKMQNYQNQNDSILRLPRGPDGSVGFQMRR